MRIVRVKLDSEVSDYLKTLCVRFAFNDLPFIEDLYALALTKGGGLPDEARMTKLVEAYAKINEMNKLVVKMLLAKRRQVLKDMAANPLFQHLTKKKKVHPREVTEQMLGFYFELYRRVRQSQCMTCSLLSNCEFGSTYGNKVTSVHAVVDPDYEKKVNPACPEKPTMDMNAQVAAAQAAMQQMAQNPAQIELAAKSDPAAKGLANGIEASMANAEAAQNAAPQDPEEDLDSIPKSIEDAWEQEDTTCGIENMTSVPPGSTTTFYSTTFSSPSVLVDMNMVNKIRMHNFLLFELARKLSSKLTKAHKGKFKPTNEVTKTQKTQQIKSVSDVKRVLPREHAQDDAVFDRKLQQRQLSMRESQTDDQKRHLLYLVIDTSDSMSSCVGSTGLWTVVSRALLAASFGLALIDLIESEHGIVFLRGFDGHVGPLQSAREPVEFTQMRKGLARCSFNGCSTNIVSALTTAVNDIKGAKSELRDAEILLITDCGDTISDAEVASMKTLMGSTVLNVMDVSSASSGMELRAGSQLRQMADHYFKVDGRASTLDQLVSLVGGNKAPTTPKK